MAFSRLQSLPTTQSDMSLPGERAPLNKVEFTPKEHTGSCCKLMHLD